MSYSVNVATWHSSAAQFFDESLEGGRTDEKIRFLYEYNST
jgi:hypothetical protein